MQIYINFNNSQKIDYKSIKKDLHSTEILLPFIIKGETYFPKTIKSFGSSHRDSEAFHIIQQMRPYTPGEPPRSPIHIRNTIFNIFC